MGPFPSLRGSFCPFSGVAVGRNAPLLGDFTVWGSFGALVLFKEMIQEEAEGLPRA